jgi:hypothetical protein
LIKHVLQFSTETQKRLSYALKLLTKRRITFEKLEKQLNSTDYKSNDLENKFEGIICVKQQFLKKLKVVNV